MVAVEVAVSGNLEAVGAIGLGGVFSNAALVDWSTPETIVWNWAAKTVSGKRPTSVQAASPWVLRHGDGRFMEK